MAHPGGIASRVTVRVGASVLSSCATAAPLGKTSLSPAFFIRLRARSTAIVLDQRVTGLETHRPEEGAGHRATDEDAVHLGQQGLDEIDLAADLGSAEHRDERPSGIVQRLAQVSKLPLHEKPRHRRLQEPGDRLRARVRPVRRAESVVDVEIAQRGEPRRQRGIVLLLAGIEPGILRHGDAAAREPLRRSHRLVGRRIRKERDRRAEQFLQLAHDRLHRVLRIGTALGPPQMREQHQPRAALAKDT